MSGTMIYVSLKAIPCFAFLKRSLVIREIYQNEDEDDDDLIMKAKL